MRIRDIKLRDIYDMYAGRHEPENLRTFAKFYWHAVLGIAFLAAGCAFVWGVINLGGIVAEMDEVPHTERIAAPTFDRAALAALVRAYDARQARFEALKAGAATSLADPSR